MGDRGIDITAGQLIQALKRKQRIQTSLDLEVKVIGIILYKMRNTTSDELKILMPEALHDWLQDR